MIGLDVLTFRIPGEDAPDITNIWLESYGRQHQQHRRSSVPDNDFFAKSFFLVCLKSQNSDIFNEIKR